MNIIKAVEAMLPEQTKCAMFEIWVELSDSNVNSPFPGLQFESLSTQRFLSHNPFVDLFFSIDKISRH